VSKYDNSKQRGLVISDVRLFFFSALFRHLEKNILCILFSLLFQATRITQSTRRALQYLACIYGLVVGRCYECENVYKDMAGRVNAYQ
jgi:hypothetical protein